MEPGTGPEQDGPTSGSGSGPEATAAAARALLPELLEAVARRADDLADDLATRLGMVAWDREEQIGAAQRGLFELRSVSPRRLGGRPTLVRELREQPLDALSRAWRALLSGREVHVESEAGACPGAYRILRDMADALGAELSGRGPLSVSAPGVLDHEHAGRETIGVAPRRRRVALLQVDADRELAAYLLARACLRRTGFDPRAVHRVIVVGPSDRLERNLRRLWVGTRMGPVDDEHAFAGPVDEARAAAFADAERAWRAREGVTTICPGGRLLRADAEGCFLAPALLRAQISVDELPGDEPELRGPMLVVHPVGTDDGASERGERLLDHYTRTGHARLRFGTKPRTLTLADGDSQIHGALLVERLPPGLPEPRP